MEREPNERDEQGSEAEPKEPPVDGPGTGSQEADLGGSSQDSPGRD